MEHELQLFKRMLGLRTLIKTACELDQAISHYITYLPSEGDQYAYELVIFAHAQIHPKPAWVVKMILEPEILARVMKIIFRMIKYYDSVVSKKEEKDGVKRSIDKSTVSKIVRN